MRKILTICKYDPKVLRIRKFGRVVRVKSFEKSLTYGCKSIS